MVQLRMSETVDVPYNKTLSEKLENGLQRSNWRMYFLPDTFPSGQSCGFEECWKLRLVLETLLRK